jgi:hypothetical protein
MLLRIFVNQIGQSSTLARLETRQEEDFEVSRDLTVRIHIITCHLRP